MDQGGSTTEVPREDGGPEHCDSDEVCVGNRAAWGHGSVPSLEKAIARKRAMLGIESGEDEAAAKCQRTDFVAARRR